MTDAPLIAPFVQKEKPGHYHVWLADIALAFRTKRDAQRFADAARRARAASWMTEDEQ